MTDIDTTQTDDAPAGEAELDVTPEDMISRGKGLKLDAIEAGTPAAAAVDDFKAIQARLVEAEAQAKTLLDERNKAIYDLKSNYNVGFTAIGELIGGTSSLALYLFERAQGKSAKQIREESRRSRAAKEKFLEPSEGKSARKQTPAEKEFRKQQKEALKAFLAAQAEANPEGEGDAGDDE